MGWELHEHTAIQCRVAFTGTFRATRSVVNTEHPSPHHTQHLCGSHYRKLQHCERPKACSSFQVPERLKRWKLIILTCRHSRAERKHVGVRAKQESDQKPLTLPDCAPSINQPNRVSQTLLCSLRGHVEQLKKSAAAWNSNPLCGSISNIRDENKRAWAVNDRFSGGETLQEPDYLLSISGGENIDRLWLTTAHMHTLFMHNHLRKRWAWLSNSPLPPCSLWVPRGTCDSFLIFSSFPSDPL